MKLLFDDGFVGFLHHHDDVGPSQIRLVDAVAGAAAGASGACPYAIIFSKYLLGSGAAPLVFTAHK